MIGSERLSAPCPVRFGIERPHYLHLGSGLKSFVAFSVRLQYRPESHNIEGYTFVLARLLGRPLPWPVPERSNALQTLRAVLPPALDQSAFLTHQAKTRMNAG